ncbi:His-Xaa-Ser system protein HxsD [Labilibaculum manganireducens]|uniref:His-Xaa-Ser system protein HxsD n=1 Tax=Labilibaculum manganireducens TaxID=1940525 RepID=UPI0029F4F4C1|nr:His-Xaa-Ser system protein HxsD [Labilibaculum manganireducens]
MSNEISQTSFQIKASGDYYTESIISKCIYWLCNKYLVSVSKSNDDFIVDIQKKEDHFIDGEIDQIESKFYQDLNDYKTREMIQEETRSIKDILLVKAFSHGIDINDKLITQILDNAND